MKKTGILLVLLIAASVLALSGCNLKSEPLQTDTDTTQQ